MNILAIDTSAVTASAAILCDGEIKGQVSFTNGLTHSQTIMPIIDYCLKGASLCASDIDLFAVAVGPGSFTGLRIGVGTAKGLSYGCGKPCVGVSTLKALAYNIAPTDKLIVPIMDARRNQVYCAAYKYSADKLVTVLEPEALGIDDLIKKLPENVIFVGDAVKVHRDYIKQSFGKACSFAPPQSCLQNAACVAYAATLESPCAPQDLEVVYLRKPQAQREREEKLGSIN